MREGDSEGLAFPVRGENSVGQRNPADSMSRRDRSSVGIVGGEVCPEPLQGLHRAVGGYWAGKFPIHGYGLPWPRTVDGCRNGICKTLVHTRLFDGGKCTQISNIHRQDEIAVVEMGRVISC